MFFLACGVLQKHGGIQHSVFPGYSSAGASVCHCDVPFPSVGKNPLSGPQTPLGSVHFPSVGKKPLYGRQTPLISLGLLVLRWICIMLRVIDNDTLHFFQSCMMPGCGCKQIVLAFPPKGLLRKATGRLGAHAIGDAENHKSPYDGADSG
ncbi:hypothetical protein NDU88_005770 [Pleurodeles waltl]|uniref:Uncharacterized protein n=1 Tax=Pleurodeles waltl TaxID=8319 RepID=A0AAV7QJ76_PLEWA|nr:hypothetical protein NDU88_005770 [Pleurodeles waltl]